MPKWTDDLIKALDSVEELSAKYNENHDDKGRFGSGSSAGSQAVKNTKQIGTVKDHAAKLHELMQKLHETNKGSKQESALRKQIQDTHTALHDALNQTIVGSSGELDLRRH